MQLFDIGAQALNTCHDDDLDENCSANAPDATIRIAGIAFGSTVSIRGPEADRFAVTDDAVTLAFTRPGRYYVHVAGSRPNEVREWAINVV